MPQKPLNAMTVKAKSRCKKEEELSAFTPFETAEEAWFWFIAAHEAKSAGAQFVAGAGLYKRPCEPVDILKVLERLYRARRLTWDHVKVLRHYGLRHMAPDYHRPKEARAYDLWHQALECMEDALIAKGIIRQPTQDNTSCDLKAFIETLNTGKAKGASHSYIAANQERDIYNNPAFSYEAGGR